MDRSLELTQEFIRFELEQAEEDRLLAKRDRLLAQDRETRIENRIKILNSLLNSHTSISNFCRNDNFIAQEAAVSQTKDCVSSNRKNNLLSESLNEPSKNSLCLEQGELTAEEGRIRLPGAIQNELIKNGIVNLSKYKAFGFRGLIVCPPETCEIYENIAKEHDIFGKQQYSQAYGNKLIDAKGRISLTNVHRTHSGIKQGDFLIMIGIGMWYELRHIDKS